MASSFGGPGMTSGVPSPRIVNLEFPPPPPYPPPHSQITRSALMEPASPITSSSRQHLLLDYSYAYYQPNSGDFHAAYPTDVLPPQQQQQQQQQEQQQQPQQQRYSQLQPMRSEPLKRHTYTTCYGTEENIYEEISEISKQCHALHGSRRSLVAEEVRRVQSRHRRVLGELNLSVEAMLMPTAADSGEEQAAGSQETARAAASADELLHTSVGPADDLLSRVGCDMDSGFSGSSSASYRSGLGSLRRGMAKTHGGAEATGGVQRKTKAAMIWKKGWKGWKKLHSFGSGAGSASKMNAKVESPRADNEEDVVRPARTEFDARQRDRRICTGLSARTFLETLLHFWSSPHTRYALDQ